MRIIYCDPHLSSNLGHNSTHARLMVRSFKQLGCDVVVLPQVGLPSSFQLDCPIVPTFSTSPYAAPSNDPWVGWIHSFEIISSAIANEMQCVNGIDSDDVIFFDAATPSALNGILKWHHSKGDAAPRLVVSLIEQSGLGMKKNEAGQREIYHASNYPMLYRLCGLSIQESQRQKIRFITVDTTFAETYSDLLQIPVHYIGHPYDAVTQPRNRVGQRPITLGFVGAQRPQKGFTLAPEIIRQILSEDLPVRILVQDGRWQMQTELKQIQAMALQDSRIELVLEAVDEAGWDSILKRCDLLMTAYDYSSYALACSGISCEALANGIPFIATHGTTMSRLMVQYGMPGVIVDDCHIHQILEAIRTAITNYDDLAYRALAASSQWKKNNGALRVAQNVIHAFELPA